jgi:putative hydrolase of the HAD superfamily
LRRVIDDPSQWIVQEYIDWPEYTVDLLADFNGRVLSVVPRSRQLVVAGESYVSRTANAPQMIEESVRLAAALHLVGHNTIQCFWNGADVKFIEVNPRFGGTLAPQVEQFESDLVMLRFTDDLFVKAGDLVGAVEERTSAGSAPGTAELQAVLFDLDNTLYPEEQFVVGGFRAAARFLAKRAKLDSERLLERMLEILHSDGRGRVFDILLKEIEIDCGAWLPSLLHVYRSHRPIISLFPDAAGVLRTLKQRGLRLGLVTDGLASVQRRKIAALGLEAYMDPIVCTGELGQGRAKPSPIPFEVALTLLDVAAKNVAYVADDISKDFAGPNRLGMKSVRVRSTGLVGVSERERPIDPMFEPQMTAASLREAVGILGLD